MKKIVTVGLFFVFVILLTACGEESQEDVVKKLDDTISSMDGYKAKAEMKMNTGQEDQTYNIDVWHKKKGYYRVALTNNKDKEGNQIILKNKDGDFVLTPELDKQFKFQTDWPDNSSQPYLFQSLVDDVKQDSDATFKVSDSNYIFQTKTNYQSNNNLPYQKIYFDKKTYEPKLVKVMDKDKKALVEVKFSGFDQKPSFDDDDFDTDSNMSSGIAKEEAASTGDKEEEPKSLHVMLPLEMAGSELSEKKEVDTEDGKRVIMTFTGDKNFTLIEEKVDSTQTLSSPKEVKGDIVNLGHSIGALSDYAVSWNNNEVSFYLASEDLTKDELVEVAKSVEGKAMK